MPVQHGHFPQGFPFSGFSQFRAFANIFAAGRLARTAGAAEQVSMRQLIGLDLVPQDLRYMILPAYV